MSRFDDAYDWEPDGPAITYEMWEHNLRRSLAGPKGQSILRTLRDTLQALPSKRLISGHLAREGDVCAVGAYCAARISQEQAIPLSTAIAYLSERESEAIRDEADDPGDPSPYFARKVTIELGVAAGLNKTLAWAISQLNDEDFGDRTPESRYEAVMDWINAELREAVPA